MTGSGWRHSAAGVAGVLSPRGALALRPVDGAFAFALRAALAMALPALPMVLSGRPELAVYAMLGSFTTTFGPNLPYPRRARVLALIAVAMTVCVGSGTALAAWAQPRAGGTGAVVVVVAMAAVAGLAKFACDAARLGGLGAVLLLFSFAVAANGSPAFADVLPQTGLAALGAAVAWVLAVLGRLVHPDRPQRLAVAAALRALADLLEAAGAGERCVRARHRATAAVLQAYRSLGWMPPTAAEQGDPGDRGGVCVRLTDLSWSLLIDSARRPPDDPVGMAHHLRRQGRLLADRRCRVPPLLPELAFRDQLTLGQRVDLRAAELVVGQHPGTPAHRPFLLAPALRIVLGTGLAGALAIALGLGHGYWAAISAAAVLHSVNVRTAAQRAVQRTWARSPGCCSPSVYWPRARSPRCSSS